MMINLRNIQLMLFCGLLGIGSPDPISQPLSLSIAAVEQTGRLGSEVRLRTKLTNISNHVLTFFDTDPDCDYLAEVRDENGNLARPTDHKLLLKCNNGLADGRKILVTLKPQESRDDEILLNRLYQLTRPGNYSVQVSRAIPKELGGGATKSNTITIKIIQ